MRSWAIRVGRVFGIELRIHLTFLFLVAFVWLTESAPHHPADPQRVLALVGLIFGCVLLHELGHALVSTRAGIRPKAIILLPIGGVTLLDGGGLAAQAQPLQFFGGSLVGTGLVTVANLQNVINSSSLSPGLPLGELDITGNYQQTASGSLNIELGGYSAGTNFDLITVSAGGAGGIATLAGTLNVSLTNGFAATNGASFTFLTAASRAGSFSIFNYPSNDIGMQAIYEPASVSLKVTNLKPIVSNPISDPAPITYGSPFNFQFAANAFADPDGDQLTFTASGFPAE